MAISENEIIALFLEKQERINQKLGNMRPDLVEPMQYAGIPISDVNDIPLVVFQGGGMVDSLRGAIGGDTHPTFEPKTTETLFGDITTEIIVHPQVLINQVAVMALQNGTQDLHKVGQLMEIGAKVFAIDAITTCLTGNPDDPTLRHTIAERFQSNNLNRQR